MFETTAQFVLWFLTSIFLHEKLSGQIAKGWYPYRVTMGQPTPSTFYLQQKPLAGWLKTNN